MIFPLFHIIFQIGAKPQYALQPAAGAGAAYLDAPLARVFFAQKTASFTDYRGELHDLFWTQGKRNNRFITVHTSADSGDAL